MCGVTSDTISPSVRSTSRNTPCVLGCCGPMFTSISSVRTSNSMMRGSSTCVAMTDLPLSCPDAVVLQRHLVIFAQGMPYPVFRAEYAPQVGVSGEQDAGQIVNFAFVPIGRAPDAADGGYFGQLALDAVFPARQHDLEHQADSVGHAPQVIDHLQVRLPTGLGGFFGVGLEIIDGADAVQKIEPQV